MKNLNKNTMTRIFCAFCAIFLLFAINTTYNDLCIFLYITGLFLGISAFCKNSVFINLFLFLGLSLFLGTAISVIDNIYEMIFPIYGLLVSLKYVFVNIKSIIYNITRNPDISEFVKSSPKA